MAELTSKQRAYMENRASGMTSVDAARAAGYKHPDAAAAQLRRKKNLAEYNRAISERLGMDDEKFMQKVIDGLDATRRITIRYKDRTEVIEEPDWLARAKFVVIMAELTGMMPASESRVQVEGRVTATASQEPKLTDPSMLTLTGDALLQAMLNRVEQRKLGYITGANDPANGIAGDDLEGEGCPSRSKI